MIIRYPSKIAKLTGFTQTVKVINAFKQAPGSRPCEADRCQETPTHAIKAEGKNNHRDSSMPAFDTPTITRFSRICTLHLIELKQAELQLANKRSDNLARKIEESIRGCFNPVPYQIELRIAEEKANEIQKEINALKEVVNV